jgi:hypothetical protein
MEKPVAEAALPVAAALLSGEPEVKTIGLISAVWLGTNELPAVQPSTVPKLRIGETHPQS